MSLEKELKREKPLRDLETLVSRYIRSKMSGGEEEGAALDGFELCVGTKSGRNKRRRAESCDVRSCSESLSHVRLAGAIAQYLLSRVPLPTSRLDLQKRFVKSQGSTKSRVDLDSILDHINDKFKSCLGLGIFGLDRSAAAGPTSQQSSSNPKYYVVQLNSSRAHLDLVYQFGSINFKSIGDLAANRDQSLLVPYRLCNSFLTFLSFLFGFFEVTFSDENVVQEEENSLQVMHSRDEIEIPVDYLLELIHEFTGVAPNSGKFFPHPPLEENRNGRTPKTPNNPPHSAPDKILKELNALLSKSSKCPNRDDTNSPATTNYTPSQIPILLYILHKTGYLIPTFSQENNTISGIKNGPLLKWNSEHIKRIIQLHSP